MGTKAGHFNMCTDENCERKWCVDRRNAACTKDPDQHEVTESGARKRRARCRFCHIEFHCSSYGWCELHGDHGP